MQSLAQYAKSVIVKITEGSENGDAYVNPKAKAQVATGTRHYVPYANISKGTYFGTDTHPGDPVKP
jgi:hypothetical protein